MHGKKSGDGKKGKVSRFNIFVLLLDVVDGKEEDIEVGPSTLESGC